jgi:hypothetical protein
MLLQALKARSEDLDDAPEMEAAVRYRRDIGKKLRLSEY